MYSIFALGIIEIDGKLSIKMIKCNDNAEDTLVDIRCTTDTYGDSVGYRICKGMTGYGFSFTNASCKEVKIYHSYGKITVKNENVFNLMLKIHNIVVEVETNGLSNLSADELYEALIIMHEHLSCVQKTMDSLI